MYVLVFHFESENPLGALFCVFAYAFESSLEEEEAEAKEEEEAQ